VRSFIAHSGACVADRAECVGWPQHGTPRLELVPEYLQFCPVAAKIRVNLA
jgi:hypothetical protein